MGEHDEVTGGADDAERTGPTPAVGGADDRTADDRTADDGTGDGTDPGALPAEVPFPGEPVTTGLPGRAEAWRRRSAAGAIFTGFAFGLRDVFEPATNEPAIVLETSGTPPRDLPVEADLEDLSPRRSVVRIRPWLLRPETGTPGDGAAPADPDEEH